MPQDPNQYPSRFHTGDVVSWNEHEAAVIDQVCRDGLVAVAVQAVAYVAMPEELR